jgi:DNA helicase-2/ATP-dependent DNA helicase PcrA
MSHYLDQLNEQQRSAVEYIDGPELVIAGAGSGKTRVLTYKIVHLLVKGFEPWRIMALTFTNKAAKEMRERITALSGTDTASKLWMGTFHSIFAKILRRHADRIGFNSNYTILDSTDSRNLIKTVIRYLNLDEKEYKPATVASCISNAKNALLSPEAYAADRDLMDADRRSKHPAIHSIFKEYRNICRISDVMDFDDLLYYTYILLRDNDDLRRHYQEFFRYILVDEYQDTNFAQHKIVELLTGDNQKLCVVGDDAQSIYSFRGANIRNILNLKRAYPTLQMFKLEQNYRSSENIINAAGTLIAKNTKQIPKNVFSENGPGSRIEVVQSYSDYEESYLVANRISQIKRTIGDNYDEFAVLYRTNAQSRLLEESLRKRNIPYRIYGGQSFYQRKEIKDAVAYFKLSINPDDDEAIRRIINIPTRGIGETTVKKLTAASLEHHVSVWAILNDPTAFNLNVNKGTLTKLDSFVNSIQSLNALVAQGKPVDQVIQEIYNNIGLLSMYASDSTPESISKRENLQELVNSAADFVQQRSEQGLEDQSTMQDYLAEVSLATDADTDDQDGDDAAKVTLMTIHAAKGLEFGNVFVVGVEEDLLPSSRSKDSAEEVEEERRLLYVAITRAKRFCMLSYVSNRYRNGTTVTAAPSRFLKDIDKKYLQFITGSSLEPRTTTTYVSPAKSFQPIERTHSTAYISSTSVKREQYKPTETANAGTIHDAYKLTVGMKIAHPRFGTGVITEIDAANPTGARIIVNFSNIDIKTLLLKFAKFTIIE